MWALQGRRPRGSTELLPVRDNSNGVITPLASRTIAAMTARTATKVRSGKFPRPTALANLLAKLGAG